MKYVFVASILAFAGHFACIAQGAELNGRVPVLVELFTSEGCSSCPPADALLMKLDQAQPVTGAQIIVLSEHVDYWNSLGWKDPFSSAQFTQRQGMYARSLFVETYTPQLIIDGRAEVSAHDEKAVDAAVLKAASRAKTAVKIVTAKREDKTATVAIQIGALGSGKGDVWVAIADDRDQSSVRNGENKGRTLNHVAVVRSLGKVGSVSKSAGLEKTVRIPLASETEGMRVVVFVTESGGPVLGTAVSHLQ